MANEREEIKKAIGQVEQMLDACRKSPYNYVGDSPSGEFYSGILDLQRVIMRMHRQEDRNAEENEEYLKDMKRILEKVEELRSYFMGNYVPNAGATVTILQTMIEELNEEIKSLETGTAENPDKNLEGKSEPTPEPSREEKIKILKAEKAILEKNWEKSHKNWQEVANKVEVAKKSGNIDVVSVFAPVEEISRVETTLKRLKLEDIKSCLENAEGPNKGLFDYNWHSWRMKETAEDINKMVETLSILFQDRNEAACREVIGAIRQFAAKVVHYEQNMIRIIGGNEELLERFSQTFEGDWRLVAQEASEGLKKKLFPYLDKIEKFFKENKDIDDLTWQKKVGAFIKEELAKNSRDRLLS